MMKQHMRRLSLVPNFFYSVPFFSVLASLALLPSIAFAQSYYSLGDGYYCIRFSNGTTELAEHTGGGNVDFVDSSEQKTKLAKNSVKIRKKLRAANHFIKTKGGSSKAFSKIAKVERPNVTKAKALAKKYRARLKQNEELQELFEQCENDEIDFTGAGNIETLFVYPAPNDFSTRNYNILYLPLTVQRNKKGKVTTNLKFCISYIKREDSKSFKLAPYEYIATFYNDPCLAGRLAGASCPNFFGGKNDYGYIVAVLNGLGSDPDYSWQAERLSDITVISRPMGKEGCLGEDGFRK